MNGATPATILALAAAVLLAVATCSAPVSKSIYFLSASYDSTTIKLGCLGYCLNDKCTGRSVGYDVADASELLGISTSIDFLNDVSTKIVKGLTYTLVLHPIGCGLAAVAFAFGVMAHCAFGMGCLGSFAAGLATSVASVAFGLDMAVFTIIKKRVEDNGGSASYGIALWLTLAAFIVLIVVQLAFCCSCCCPGGGGRGNGRKKDRSDDYETPHPDTAYGDRMRMDALAAEANRNNSNNNHDLPKFAEYVTEHEVPLKDDYVDDAYDDRRSHGQGQSYHAVGQAYGTPGADAGAYAAYPQQQHQQHQHGGYATDYVAGVGPAYGSRGGYHDAHGGEMQQYNDMGAYAPYDQQHPQQTQATQATSYDAYVHDPYANDGYGGGGGAVAAAYHNTGPSRQQSYDLASQRQPSLSAASQRNYAPSVGATSGYAVGGPSSMAMPQAVQGSNAVTANNLGRDAEGASQYGGAESSGSDRRRPTQTQDDGFGLSALQAGTVAAAAGHGHGHEEGQTSGMYYNAQETRGEQQHEHGGYHHGAEDDGEEGMAYAFSPTAEEDGPAGTSAGDASWQRSASSRSGAHSVVSPTSTGAGGAGSREQDVPSYEMAIGATPSPAAGASMSRPLPVPGAAAAGAGGSSYPREKW